MRKFKRLLMLIPIISIFLSSSIITYADGAKVLLSNMHELESDYVEVLDESITDSYGNTYSSNIVEFNARLKAYATYDLNGNYSSFDATIVCSEDAYSGTEIYVGIFADGVLIYSLKNYTRQQAPEQLSLDVSGVGELSIMTRTVEDDSNKIYFVDSYFTKSNTQASYPTRWDLDDLVIIDSYNIDTHDRMFIDIYGDVHKGLLKMKPSGSLESYVLYNLNASYATFCGTIISSEDTYSDGTGNVYFYLDDVEVYRITDITRTTAAIPFEIDVTNAKVLKIVATKNSSTFRVNITDTILKVHEHVLSDWVITNEPTCVSTGRRVQTCVLCGEEINSETIPPLGHTPDGVWIITEEPTCVSTGRRVQTCTVCGEAVNEESIPALGHTTDGTWEITREATCALAGEEVQYCTVCHEVCDSREIPVLDHTPSKHWETVKDPTCVEEGLKVRYCTECGQAVEQETIETIDHDFGDWTIVSGSIWNNPIVRERECTMCGEVESEETSPTAWLKPLVVVIVVTLIVGIVVICITLKMNNLPLRPSSVKQLFKKDSVTDEEIEKLLNKPDESSAVMSSEQRPETKSDGAESLNNEINNKEKQD